MPSWMKEKLEFSATIDKSSTETIKNLTEETSTRAKRITDATVVTNTPPQQRNSSTHINSVEAAKINALNASEPVVIHEPLNVDASITISNLNISGGRGSADEIHAAVNQALERQAKQQRLAIASSFSD
ncbi:hypothetical protein [Bartonella sp. CB74]|uniref:hypothetical protein n=1 Tax=Bartonella sp. CB74 TaxID=3113620 RepID=UPI002F96CCA1